MPKQLIYTWRSRLLLCALVVAAVLPPLIALRTQIRWWVEIPVWDEWDTPGIAILHWAQHKLSWADLIAQHNESRKVLPRLIGIVLSLSGEWDVRRSMVVTFLSYCSVAVAALLFLRRCTKTRAGTLAALACMNSLLFAPSQYENLLSSYIYEFMVPVLCLFTAVAMNLSGATYIRKTFWCSALALIATYTFAHGMLLWPLLWPLPNTADWSSRSRRLRSVSLSALYLGIGLTAVLYYFAGYQRPVIAPEPAKLSQAAEILRFVSVYLGSVLQPIRVKPELIGAFVLCSSAAVGAAAIYLAGRGRAQWRCCYPWMLLGLFSGGSAFLTAIGRVNIGTDVVFAETFYGFSAVRYNAAAVAVWIALVGLAAVLFASAGGSAVLRRGRNVLIGIGVAAVLLAWLSSYRNEQRRLAQFHENRLRARVATIWAECLPENPELFAAYPYVPGFSSRVAEFRHAGLLRLPKVAPELASTVARQPNATAVAGGWLDRVSVADETHLSVSGWARDAIADRPAKVVIVGYERNGGPFQPFATVLVGKPRPDVVSKTANKSLRQCGFDQTIDASNLRSGHFVFGAWALDLPNQRAFALSGTVTLNRD